MLSSLGAQILSNFAERTRSTSNDRDVVQGHSHWYEGQYTEHDTHTGIFGSQQIGTVTTPRRHHVRKGKRVVSNRPFGRCKLSQLCSRERVVRDRLFLSFVIVVLGNLSYLLTVDRAGVSSSEK